MGKTVPDYPRGITFEMVWAALMEDREKREKDRLEWEKRSAQLDKQIGELGNRFGELAEHLVGPSIMEKFNEQGFVFTQRSRNIEIIFPDDPKTYTDVDMLLENGDIVIAVEIKATPTEKDVKKHIERMELIRRRADAKGDKRKYRGAIAGAIVNKSICDTILHNGFYLIEQTGDTVKITIPEGFIAREW